MGTFEIGRKYSLLYLKQDKDVFIWIQYHLDLKEVEEIIK